MWGFLRKLALYVFIFCAGAFLGKPLGLSMIGASCQLFVYLDRGWKIGYSSLDYHDGVFFIHDLSIRDDQLFTFKSSKLSLSLSSQHLLFEPITLVLRDQLYEGASSKELSSVYKDLYRLFQKRWTVQIAKGDILGAPVGAMKFSFEKKFPQETGRLHLQWDHESVFIEGTVQTHQIQLQTEFKNFHLERFHRWADCSGLLNGTCHFVFNETCLEKGTLDLQVDQGAYATVMQNIKGRLEWEGHWSPCWLDFMHSENIRCRLSVDQGECRVARGKLIDCKGEFSFFSGIGAKWNGQAQALANGETKKIEASGRAFVDQERACWLDCNLQSGDALFSLEAQKKKQLFECVFGCENMSPFELTFAQSWLMSIEPTVGDFDVSQGLVELQGKVYWEENKIQGWKIASVIQDLVCQKDAVFDLSCKEFSGSFSSTDEKGAWRVEDCSFQTYFPFKKSIKGDAWEGQFEIDHQKITTCALQGYVEDIELGIDLDGYVENFHMNLQSINKQVSLLGSWKEGVLSLEIEKGEIENFCFKGRGVLDRQFNLFFQSDWFQGELPSLVTGCYPFFLEETSLFSLDKGRGFQLIGSLQSVNWSLEAKGTLRSGIPFYCPVIEKQGNDYTFDLRVQRPTWDMLRLSGSFDETNVTFDTNTHFLGSSLGFPVCELDGGKIKAVSCTTQVPIHTFLATLSAQSQTQLHEALIPFQGHVLATLKYDDQTGAFILLQGESIQWKDHPISFKLSASGKDGVWVCSDCEIMGLACAGQVYIQDDFSITYEGKGFWKDGVYGQFKGNMSSDLKGDIQLSKVSVDLEKIGDMVQSLNPFLKNIKGICEVEGDLFWHQGVHASLEVSLSNIQVAEYVLENQGPLLIRYGLQDVISLRGIDVQVSRTKDPHFQDPLFKCKADSLEYDPLDSFWKLSSSHLFFPVNELKQLSFVPFPLQEMGLEKDLDLIADLQWASNWSQCFGFMKEAWIPLNGSIQHVQNVSFSFTKEESQADFYYVYQDHLLKIHANLNRDPILQGRISFEDTLMPLNEGEMPLTVCWNYLPEQGLSIREIEGNLAGVEACFHAIDQDSSLIGTARIQCASLGEFVPPRIKQLFEDLKMGKGYELKGRLFFENKYPAFQGLLSGKQVDLFGYQLRTLLAQIELSYEKVHLFDFKISDSAGIMKIDQIFAEAQGNNPWTLSIPHLTILELRPSLLQKPGQDTPSLSPLVVRELHLEGLQGLLDDSSTYTAKGELRFINSYRREHTLLDLPADLLGRLVGLDLELLIPTCGSLSYELRQGRFFLTELKGAYSEGKRSEFFLVFEESQPFMDLDGHLQILVQMKQFVLFKFMDSFMISIEGYLNDPKFQLQKKRRFWGL